MKIAIIPCHNGLGHIHRMHTLGKYFSKKYRNIFFFLNKNKKLKKSKFIKYLDARLPSNYSQYLKYEHTNVLRNLKLEDYDIILTDNFYNLPINKKSLPILHANFFWPQISNNSKHIKNLKAKLRNYSLIYTNYLFTMISFKNVKTKSWLYWIL